MAPTRSPGRQFELPQPAHEETKEGLLWHSGKERSSLKFCYHLGSTYQQVREVPPTVVVQYQERGQVLYVRVLYQAVERVALQDERAGLVSNQKNSKTCYFFS